MLQKGRWSIVIVSGTIGAIGVWFAVQKVNPVHFTETTEKQIVVTDDGFEMRYSHVAERTVGEFEQKHGIVVRQEDVIYPSSDTPLVSGTHISIVRAREIHVKVDGGERVYFTQARSVEAALIDGGIQLDDDDVVKPDRSTPLRTQTTISVTRVDIKEESKESTIAFDTQVNEDATLSWRKKVVTQKGENGVKSTVYRVAYYDGKEVNRRVVRTETIKDPVPEKVTQGTFVQVGKSHRGNASWYAFTGTMAAANPWLPIGSYVRVTNLDNGKSVVVRINDRGPFAPGRIIDLDKVAFAKIASLGAGVISVKMDEVTN